MPRRDRVVRNASYGAARHTAQGRHPFRRFVIVGLLVPSVACAGGGGDSSVSFPKRPAACAGARQGEDQGLPDWNRTRQAVIGDDAAQQVAVWVSFDAVKDVATAQRIVRDHRLDGVLLVWRERQGTTAKAWDTSGATFDGRDLAERATATLARALQGADDQLLPADASVLAGEPPVGGVLLVETPERVAAFVARHRCVVYGVSLGVNSHPPLSSRLEPPT